jgi:hypothetical protein
MTQSLRFSMVRLILGLLHVSNNWQFACRNGNGCETGNAGCILPSD